MKNVIPIIPVMMIKTMRDTIGIGIRYGRWRSMLSAGMLLCVGVGCCVDDREGFGSADKINFTLNFIILVLFLEYVPGRHP